MAIDRKEPDEGFLGRWSRRKTEARETPPVPVEQARPIADPQEAQPELPSLDKLTFDSDFTEFFHPKVDEDVRRAALRKLFSDPHFNVMDGLDVYIDDYTKTTPLTPGMLERMEQLAFLGDRGGRDEAEKRAAAEKLAAAQVPGVPQESASLPEIPHDSAATGNDPRDDTKARAAE